MTIKEIIVLGQPGPVGPIGPPGPPGTNTAPPVALSGSNGSFTFQTATFGNLNGLSFYTSNGSMVGSYTVPVVGPPMTTHDSAHHSGNIIPAAVQDFGPFAFSLGTAAQPAASADRLVFYGFNENGKTRFGMITPDGSQITHAQDQFIIARNTSGSPITAGKAVYVTGSTGQTPNIAPAQADSSATMPAIGITVDSIDNNAFGRVMISGVADQLNTSGFPEGTRLWVSATVAGDLTDVEPTYPNLRQRVAIVLNEHAVQGKLLVLIAGARGEFGIQAISAGTTRMTSGEAVFANANGLSFGVDGNTVTASHNGITQQSTQPVALSGSNGSFVFSTATFGNLNGLSFYTSNGSMVGSYTVPAVPAQSNQTIGGYAVGNTTGQSSSSTFDARSVSIDFAGFISGGWSNGTLRISGTQTNPVVSNAIQPVGSATGSGTNTSRFAADDHVHAGVFSMGVSNIGNTAGDTRVDVGRFVLAGGANVTLQQATAAGGLNTISISAPAGGGGDAIRGIAAGGSTATTNTVNFSNSNGVSFGFGAAGNSTVITASHNALTSQSNQAVSGQNGSFTFQTVSFSNANGISFGTSAGPAITASYTVPTQSVQTLGGYFVGNTTGQSSSSTWDARTLSIQGDGIVSAGWSNGSIRVSATQSNQAFSAAGGSSAFQTLGFSDNGRASFTNTNGSVGVAQVRASLFAVGNTTQSSSGTQNLDAISFRGDGVASVGVTNGSVVVSVPAGGGGLTNINVSAGTTSQNLSNLVFSNSNGVSFGLNGSTITASAAGGGGGGTVDRWIRLPLLTAAGSLQNNSSVSIFPFNLGGPLAFSNVRLAMSLSGATTTITSSAGMAMSISFVLYTRNVSTLSSLASGSQTYSGFYQSNSVTQTFGGPRGFTVDVNGGAITLVPDEYWMAIHVSTATSGQTSLAKSISMGVLPSQNAAFAGLDPFMSATTNTRGAMVGLGVFSTNATRATIAFTALTGQASNSATLANLWCDLRNWSIW